MMRAGDMLRTLKKRTKLCYTTACVVGWVHFYIYFVCTSQSGLNLWPVNICTYTNSIAFPRDSWSFNTAFELGVVVQQVLKFPAHALVLVHAKHQKSNVDDLKSKGPQSAAKAESMDENKRHSSHSVKGSSALSVFPIQLQRKFVLANWYLEQQTSSSNSPFMAQELEKSYCRTM